MSAWRPAGAGATGGRQFYNEGQGAPTAMGSVYRPTVSGSDAAPQASAPGVISINPLDPKGTAESAGEGLGALFAGLKTGLFGSYAEDSAGKHGGLLGDIPVVGGVARLGSQVLGAAGDVVGAVAGAAGGVAERIPSGSGDRENIAEEWNKLPADFKAKWQAKIDAEHGLFGSGLLDNSEHLKSAAIRANREEQQFKDPTLFGSRFTPSGSLADTLTNVMDLLGSTADLAQRAVAGARKPGSQGMNRLEVVMAVAEGKVGFTGGPQGLTPVEELTAAKVRNGDWTEAEALDFLTTHGSGYSHDPGLQVAGTVALDPLNAATFGAAAIAKAGLTGATLVARSERAAAMLEEAQAGLKAAEEAASLAKGARATKLAEADRAAAAARVETAQTSVDAFKAYTGMNAPRAINVLGRASQGSEKAAQFLKLAGKAYGGLEGTAVGRMAKVTRTLIDPLHAIDLHMPGAARTVDLLSDALPKALVDTIGPEHHMGLLEDLTQLDPTGATRDLFSRDLATAVSNRGREGVAELYRAGQFNAGLGEELMKTLPGDVLDEALKVTKERDLLKWLRYDAVQNVLGPARNMTDVTRATMAQQLEALYHVRPADEWLKLLEKMPVQKVALLKHAIYGNSNRQLLNAVANSATHASAATFDLNRMVLLAKGTLTRVGADSLLSKLKAAKSLKAKTALIREWQGRYPQLGFISIDEANAGKSVEDFTSWVSDHIDRLPMQVTHDELGTMHPDVQDLSATLGDGYSLGFRPEEQFLWGLERSNEVGGGYRAATAPWIDHVADGGLGYRPGRALRLNIAGNPIVGVPVKIAAKTLDYMEVGARVLKAQISGAQIAEVARQRFVSDAARGRFAEAGLTEGVAQSWWDRIQTYTREHQGYSGPRGFGKGDLYHDLFREKLIPHTLLNGSTRITENDVMRMVMEAYDGDVRYIGLTQKLSGRAKRMLFETTGSNFAGQIAEHAWPLLKFRYNPIFQLQEKIEPWVLNAQRGISVATGVKASAADLATERLLQRMTDNSLIRQADLDQAEFSAQVLLGKGFESLAQTPGTKLGKMKAMASTLLEVQGVKRLNMLRTFRAGLGKELRGAWETSQPGVWDDMKELADVRAGRVLDEDEFALQIMGEQLFSNDIVVDRLAAAGKGLPDFANAIKTGAWHTPATLGELQPLDLDHVAASLRIPGVNGKAIENLPDLRRYVAEEHSRVNEVTDALRRLGADPDYVQRVENSLTFSWTGFWKTAAERFSLTSEDSRALQDMVAGAAGLRGMQPADFMSQVFDPAIVDGAEGMLGSLSKAKDLRAKLAGTAGESTREDLIRQMSAVFADYLDPSAKRALLMEFKPELRQAVESGRVKFDLRELQTMWDSEATDTLADRIVGYMDGKLGTGAHDVVTDDAKGVAAVRKGADRYMAQRGVTPHDERRYYAVDQPFYEDSARAFSALPEQVVEPSGRLPNIASVRKAGLDLKPRPAGVDERTYEAYQDFVVDTRAQWDHMTKPVKDGGMGIKVTVAKTDPYADSAAMRADVATGHLRVLGASSDHALMTNEQNIMFRAVHDVFGHAAEGFEFGPRGELNAAIKHSQMYSDTGRAAMLTQTHGQTSWVNFSDDPVPGSGPFVPAATWDEARSAYRANFPDVADVAIDKAVVWDYETSLGQGIDLLANNGLDGEMTDLVNALHGLRSQFPQVPLPHIDAADLDEALLLHGVQGLAIGAPEGKTALIFNEKMWTDPNFVQRGLQGEAEFGQIKPGEKFTTGGETMLRHTDEGVPFARGAGDPLSVVYHEYGHAVDTWLRYGKPTVSEDLLQPYLDFADDFTDMTGAAPKWMEKAQKQLSEYARVSDEEGMAELLGVALNPSVDRAGLPKELGRAVDQLNAHLDSMGLRAKPAPAQTVREANAAKRGTVYAPQKAGLLPQDILDRFGEQFVGIGKHVESNPDVARTAQMFGKWSSKVVENGLLKGSASPHAAILHDIAGIPTRDAVPYNLTEGLAMHLASTRMAEKWRDAFRLQYFAQERSMLERTVNHPMFGLYPASYMWGKLGPEVVNFLAQKPFGIRTGGLAYSLMDTQAAIALQREYDPAFDAHIEKLGHSQALSFLGYMLPTLPWDVTASAPAWMKDIAQQGQRSDASVAAGGAAEGFNALKPTVDTVNKLNPLSTTLPWFGRAVGEVTKATDRQDLVQAPVTGAELGTPLALTMQELREALAK